MVLGVDVYSGYGRIDFKRAKAAGVEFCIPKCTEGNEPAKDDTRYVENIAGAVSTGMLVGPGYHYAYPLRSGKGLPAGRSAKEQAKRAFVVAERTPRPLHGLPHALDIEWPPHFEKDGHGGYVDLWKTLWDVTAEFIAEWTLEYLAEYTRLARRKPMVCTMPDFWDNLDEFGMAKEFADYDLWLMNYTHPNVWMPPDGFRWRQVGPWKQPTFVQFSAEGSPIMIPGIGVHPLDRDVFLGSLEELRRYCGWDPDAITERELSNPPSTPIVHALPDTLDFLKRPIGDE